MKDKITNNSDVRFIFFGTDDFSVETLRQLKNAVFLPQIIVTAPDRPAGRGHKMHKSAVKIWAESEGLEIMQPNHLDADFLIKLDIRKKELDKIEGTSSSLDNYWDIFVVSSYGKIIPQIILDLPKKGTLNVHPSLLPLYRGASPVESAMLADDRETGVTIMLMDEEMDHGEILNQEFVDFTEWPTKIEVENKLATIGGEILVRTIPLWLSGEIEEQDQDHKVATFTKKITKEDGLIEFDAEGKFTRGETGRQNFLKIQALNPWPGVYFFINSKNKQTRVKITKAQWNPDATDGELEILKVVPEGRREMSYTDFLKGFVV